MRKLLLFIIIGTVISCNKYEFITEQEEQEKQVIIRAGVESGTRSTVTYGNTIEDGEDFKWLTGDQISVLYPQGGGYSNVRFNLQRIDPDNDNKADFSGTLGSPSYNVLYGFSPYQNFGTTPSVRIPQEQTQNGKSTNHIDSYDYMVAKRENVSRDDVAFSFKHLNPMLRFVLNNNTAKDYRISGISINYKEKDFNARGVINLDDLKYNSYSESYKSMSLSIKSGGSDISFPAGETVNGYMMLFPTTELSETDKFNVSSNYTDTDGKNLYAVDLVLSKTDNLPAFVGGTRYCFILNMSNVRLLWEGAGTAASPYEIKTKEDLKSLANRVNNGYKFAGKYFKVINNIALDGTEKFTPIGTNGHMFSGNLDGNNKTIDNLYADETEYVGLFGMIMGATIKDLTVSIAPGGITGTDFVGGLVGEVDQVGGGPSQSIIDNCHITGTGKISGSADPILGCTGGLIGRNNNAIITNCDASVSVEGFYDVGGLVGYNSGLIEDCYASGNVKLTGVSASAGGFVGTNNTDIKNSYATGTVESNSNNCYIGGFIGFATDDVISGTSATNCYATGAVTISSGTQCSGGGFIGYNVGSSTSGCYATGNVTGVNSTLGGFMGYNTNSGSITNCYAKGDVSGGTFSVGGLVGRNSNSIISTSYASGSVSNTSGTNNIGGLVGTTGSTGIYSSAISNSYAKDEPLIGTNTSSTTIVTSVGVLAPDILPTGFDSSVWTAVAGGYPKLNWE